ncbi:hypothetical protein N0B31_17110 [Salinirubellus salinus]|uniref:Uncharacterized protein n=1 Tax=Salinirubellus salinus TaxID=1364945 RepID=A0A9E7UAJ5_9EURY|nr:hypothetical protein [Salinirubellus salinus]UWM53839.1 hypothetical protein N0B31_17110 [Salinirubellus salinus]
MTDDLPAELDPADLPDDPELLKQLVCDLYATVVASEEFIDQLDGAELDDETGMGWLTHHLAEGSPVGGERED